mgnify:CR=1 FL=1
MKHIASYILGFLFLMLCVLSVLIDGPIEFLKELLSGMGFLSYVAYVLILTAAVVFMPLTVMPIIPIASGVLGPFTTGVLSVIGWSLGGAIAFLISRHVGRPVLERFVNLESLDTLLERIPERTHFWFIVLLRLTLPVDLVSYALGLVKTLSFTSYIAATIVGVTWFSFAFAYMGDAFFKGESLILTEMILASVAVFSIAWYLLRRKK